MQPRKGLPVLPRSPQPGPGTGCPWAWCLLRSPGKGAAPRSSRAPTSPCSAELGHSSVPWVASLGVPQRGPEAWWQVARTQKWPRCLKFMSSVSITVCMGAFGCLVPKQRERWDLGAFRDMGQKPPKQSGGTRGPCFLGFSSQTFQLRPSTGYPVGMLRLWVLLSHRRTPQLPHSSVPWTGTLAQLSFGAPLHQALPAFAIAGLLLGEGSWVLRPRLPTPSPPPWG